MKIGTNVILWNGVAPHAPITAILMDRCPQTLLESCNVPRDARVSVLNNTPAVIVGDSVFVRGVNSVFWPVQTTTTHKRFYVHEQLVTTVGGTNSTPDGDGWVTWE